MTERQEENIRKKIQNIKQALATDKKSWGGQYHDGQGLRYLPPEYFIKLKDYKGSLRYFRWFDKVFYEDMCYPIFLFEYTFTLFKTNKIIEAEKKAFQTFFSNTYIFDRFLENELLHFEKWEGSNLASEKFEEGFPYKKSDPELSEFAIWLTQFLQSPKFYRKANDFIEIEKLLKYEPVGSKRTELMNRLSKLRAEP